MPSESQQQQQQPPARNQKHTQKQVTKNTTTTIEVQGVSNLLHAERPIYKFFHSTPSRQGGGRPPVVRRPAPAAAPESHANPHSFTHSHSHPSTITNDVDDMIGLLTLAGIPTTIAIAEGVSESRKPRGPTSAAVETAQMRKFNIRCYCAGSSNGKKEIHKGQVVLGDGNVYVQSPAKAADKTELPKSLLLAESFYVQYPDKDRSPPVLGLVAKASNDPPLLNWIYIDKKTSQVKHANRSGSIVHGVGDFGSTDGFEEQEAEADDEEKDGEDDEDEPSGITFDDEEKFVVVQPPKGSDQERDGLWEVWWDEADDKLDGGKKVEGRLVLRASLEREIIEEEEKEKKETEEKKEKKQKKQKTGGDSNSGKSKGGK